MDLRRYLEDRRRGETYDERNRHNPDYEEQRRPNKIGYGSDFAPSDNRMRMHKEEYDFQADDFEEAKETTRYTPTGSNRTKLMSMEELIEKMEKSFKKELCDVMRYCKMAECAEAEGLKELADGLYEMCYEEYTHATFLKTSLKRFGRDPEKTDSDVAKLWHKVSQKYEES